MTADPVLDPVVIADLRLAQRECDNPTFIRQLIELFRANAPVRLVRIREAIVSRDANALTHTAHTLKSNGAMLGAKRLADFCARLESYGETAAFDDAAALLNDAETELSRVLAALTELLRIQSSAGGTAGHVVAPGGQD